VKNSGDNVFGGIPVGKQEPCLLDQFLTAHDFSTHTCKAIKNDVRKFARWFTTANKEPFRIKRVTIRDVADFRDHLRREQGQAVATVNRALVMLLRRFFGWLVDMMRLSQSGGRRSFRMRSQGRGDRIVRRFISSKERLARGVQLAQAACRDDRR